MLIKKLNTLLVADIGGTNARFGVAVWNEKENTYKVEQQITFSCKEFLSFQSVMKSYLDKVRGIKPFYACIAIAGPVTSDFINMTNLQWSFHGKDISKQFNFERVTLINDFGAKAYATLHLPDNEMPLLRKGVAVKGAPRLVLGPGTGLGVASLTLHGDKWYPLCGEGGHMTFAPTCEKEFAIRKVLCPYDGHISVEKLVSGGGLESLYRALSIINGAGDVFLEAKEISKRAVEKTDVICSEAVAVFLRILGSAAADMALTLGAFGGVYLGGGILPQIKQLIHDSKLISSFNSKGRMEALLKDIPIYLLEGKNPSLLGAAYYLRNLMKDEFVLAYN